MSKTAKRERTRGFLDRVERIRKDRKLIECLKADDLYCDLDYDLLTDVPAAC